MDEARDFCISVDATLLRRAIRTLARYESVAETAELSFEDGTLRISIGNTVEELPAAGFWKESVFFTARWASALAKHPVSSKLTVITLQEGRLCVDNFSVQCSVGRGEKPGID